MAVATLTLQFDKRAHPDDVAVQDAVREIAAAVSERDDVYRVTVADTPDLSFSDGEVAD